ncbi:lysosomal alpha-glucosidase-like [Athalia rosae]|uniref:lysosomal alpha-glucosidase-like n=1 Tax=Athalia rosae TaxID=37344 RepID=UPI00203437A5|nr:lysosomal alpha-glucosidase-like [Athalia rosae]XP_048513961.1 lysosomal alpha-glucosidase-like [Athalia rosae]
MVSPRSPILKSTRSDEKILPLECSGNSDRIRQPRILGRSWLSGASTFTRLLIISFAFAASWYIMFTVYVILTRGTSPINVPVQEDLFQDYNWDEAAPALFDSPDSFLPLERGVPRPRNKYDNSIDGSVSSSAENSNLRDSHREPPAVQQCQNIPRVFRFDCHPQEGASQSSCAARGCCWEPLDNLHCTGNDCVKNVPLNVPYCYYPEDWPTYNFVNTTQDGNDFSGYLLLGAKTFYENDLTLIKMESTGMSDSILRVKIYDPSNPRYEPPWPVRSDWNIRRSKDKRDKYVFRTEESTSGFTVKRSADNTTLFDSIGKGGFTFADQFLQLHSTLPSHNIYGLGEHRSTLRLDTNWQSFTMFNRDQAPVEKTNLYGTHPFYLVIEESGNCHGVLFLNSNAMDVILQPAPAITFRTIGGIFDVYFFLGPSPADVLRQYSEIVGKPFLPPYWSLGFHLCRYGYGSLANTRAVWNRTRNAGIPFDVQWNDIDYMDRNNDFTFDTKAYKELPQFVEEIHSAGMHYIPIIDAGVSAAEKPGTYPPYDEGVKDDIFIKDAATDKPFIAKVWNSVSTAWPDFTNPKTTDYYHRMLQNTYNMFKFDGIWIDMNEPSNFYDGLLNGCVKNNLNNPQYVPNVRDGSLSAKTLCMDAKHYLGPHYNVHNTHGIGQAIATNSALTKIRNKRPFIISRSTWEGFGHYAGHWSGDVFSEWHDLRMSVQEVLSYGLFQIPMVGADICGFNGNTTVSLCNRWVQLGAFYPFSRNHNSVGTIEQDPVALGDMVVKSSRKALLIRYRFLPHLYTLFFKAHKFGDTVARPLFFEFINDQETYGIDTQFLWGSSLMVIPVLEENAVQVTAYIPRGPWYDFYSKAFIFSTGKYVTLNAPLDTIPLMIRGGSILPAQTPNVTTTLSRKNKFELLVALDTRGFARGEMYWDDGDSLDSIEKKQYKWLEFTVKDQKLTNREVERGDFNENMVLGKVSVMGVNKKVKNVFLNGNQMNFIYDQQRSYLNVKNLNVDLKTNFDLSWTYE